MPDISDGQTVEFQGSAAKPYVLKNVGGVYSCSCPAWRNQSLGIEKRSCKHLKKYRGEAAEAQRIGNPAVATPTAEKKEKNAPSLLLAQTWDGNLDIEGWLLSEKLDGVRAYWDGTQFVSRNGNHFYAPSWFIQGLPKIPLDGELWLAHKSFQRTVSIVRRQDASPQWSDLKFVVFDAPTTNGSFEERLKTVREALTTSSEFAVELAHGICRGTDHLQEELKRIIELGGEGIMLRQPGSRYVAGRSSTLLKVKQFQDAEALVIGHQKGTGRHKGRLGALAVVLPNGTEFAVGTGFSDAERENPPTIGSTITFRYQELSDGGVPRFPSFVRVCSEVH